MNEYILGIATQVKPQVIATLSLLKKNDKVNIINAIGKDK